MNMSNFLSGLVRFSLQVRLLVLLVDRRELHRRIRVNANFRSSEKWRLLSMIVLAGLGVIFRTNAQAPKVGNTTNGKPETILASTTNETRELRRGSDPIPQSNDTNMPLQAVTLTVLNAVNGQPVV